MQNNDLHVLLNNVFRSHWRLGTNAFAAHGLSSAQPKILFFLNENGGAKQRQIAEGCNIDPATVTSILTGMEKSDLVIRRPDEQDRRVVRTYLTENGQYMAQGIDDVFLEIEKIAFKDFDPSEIIQFKEMFRRIGNNLQKAERR